jgi:hypothetical protein
MCSALFFNSKTMLITATIVTALPFLGLAYFIVQEKRRVKGASVTKKRRISVNIWEIEQRYPFVTLIEAYYLRKYNDPSYKNVELNGDTARELRLELFKAIRKRNIGS